MFFFRKQKFFLDLTEPQSAETGGEGGEAKVVLAPPAAPGPLAPAAKGKKKTAPAKAATVAVAAAPAAVVPAPLAPASLAPSSPAPSAEASPAPALTTAEEIAAQLAVEAASRPAPTLTTFAPECVVPGGATPRRRRKAGANLAVFKEMAKGMRKS